jgi:hypothetical protein
VITPSTPTPNTNRPLASERLKQGSIYTRKDLSAIYAIKDASLNNGIFRLKEYDSVWLFITEHKTSDRTPYVDSLEGDTLHMQGQRLGRTDALIKDHRLRGLELLVFYRKAKYEHPFAGFRYEGIFNYHSHTGSTPTSFVLNRSQATGGNWTIKAISILTTSEMPAPAYCHPSFVDAVSLNSESNC